MSWLRFANQFHCYEFTKFKIINLSETDQLLKSNHTKPVIQINDKLP